MMDKVNLQMHNAWACYGFIYKTSIIVKFAYPSFLQATEQHKASF